MGRFFGKRWKIDGVTAGPISRHYPANGRYSVIFERDDAFLEQIEKINWAKPTIQRLSEDANEQGLPEGYGFKVVDIKYDNSGRHYTVELQTASQYLGDVTQYQEQIAELENDTTTSEDTDAENNSEDASPFRDFSGQDYDGNTVDESLFSNNAVTVVNFWFTGCKPCVAELSKLNELNDAIKSMGGEVVGINTETFDANKDAIKEAASILESQGAKYRNLSIASDSAAGKYASDIMAFPTTILVDRNGNIVGEPMLGGIDNQDNYDTLMKQIQSVIDADSAK